MMMTSTHPRRGVALFAALALMSLIALLVAGATASTRASQRASRLAHTDASLTTAADYALANVLADARGLGLADLPLGTPTVLDAPIPGAPDVHVSVAVTRLPAGVLWMVADALAGADRGHRRVNLVAAFPSFGGRIAGAVTARGDVEIGSRRHVPPRFEHRSRVRGPRSGDRSPSRRSAVVSGDRQHGRLGLGVRTRFGDVLLDRSPARRAAGSRTICPCARRHDHLDRLF